MLSKNPISSIKSFSKMIGALLNTSCFYLSPNLEPDGYMINILCPVEIEDNINNIFFGGILTTLKENAIYSVCDSFNLQYNILKLENNDGFFVIGPFITSTPENNIIIDTLQVNQISIDRQNEFVSYYSQLNVFTYTQLYHIFKYLIETNYNLDIDVIPIKTLHINNKLLKNSLLFKGNIEELLTPVIQQRYEAEALLLHYISQGNLTEAANLLNIPYNIKKYPDNLSTKKNFLIVQNTLFRTAIQKSGVHPIHIDRISNQYMQEISKLSSCKKADLMKYEMLVDYCTLVQKYSTINYPPLIRRAIDYINFNLGSKLTLSSIASHISISPHYLSTLFKQEVGKSITTFIAEKRMDQAIYFLKESHLSIGEISLQVGFLDLNYFSKVFKKTYGLTPSEFRESLINKC